MRLVIGCALIGMASQAQAQELIGLWEFEPGAELVDTTGNWNNVQLVGNASVSGGALDLNGSGSTSTGWARAQGSSLGTITDKTLISWVRLDTLSADDGSAMGIDSQAVDRFDSIVYGEGVNNRWYPGSTSGSRSQVLGTIANDSATNVVRQMAISYEDLGGDDVRVTVCRDGIQLGQYTVADQLASWSGGDAEILWGARHTLGSTVLGALDAHIEEARLYDYAMDCTEVDAVALDSGTGSCPDDPNKDDPGFCGCDWIDLDLDLTPGAETCVHSTAFVHPAATLQPGAVVFENAVVGRRATIGSNGSVGVNGVVGSGADVQGPLGPDVVIGRGAQVLNNTQVGEGSLIGYDSSFDLNMIGEDTTIAGLVSLGYMTSVGDNAVVGRGGVLGGSVTVASGAVVGPSVMIGDGADLLANSRVRKQATIGSDATVGQGARVGRDVSVGANGGVGMDATVGARAIISPSSCVADNARIPRGDTVSDPCN